MASTKKYRPLPEIKEKHIYVRVTPSEHEQAKAVRDAMALETGRAVSLSQAVVTLIAREAGGSPSMAHHDGALWRVDGVLLERLEKQRRAGNEQGLDHTLDATIRALLVEALNSRDVLSLTGFHPFRRINAESARSAAECARGNHMLRRAGEPCSACGACTDVTPTDISFERTDVTPAATLANIVARTWELATEDASRREGFRKADMGTHPADTVIHQAMLANEGGIAHLVSLPSSPIAPAPPLATDAAAPQVPAELVPDWSKLDDENFRGVDPLDE